MKIISAAVAVACLFVAAGASAEHSKKVVAKKEATAGTLSVVPDIRYPGGHTG